MIAQLILACLLTGDTRPFAQGVRLAQIPEHSQYLLHDPTSFDVDEQGNYYLVDFAAKIVFSWDKEGAFKGTIGRPGQGPGEFTFNGAKGTCFLSVAGDRLFVLDGWQARAQVFELDGTYVSSIDFDVARARVHNFAVTKEGPFILLLRRGMEDGRYLSLGTFDHQGNPLNTLSSLKDVSFVINRKKKQKHVTVHVFHPTMVTSFDGKNSQILVGNSEKPSFQVFHMNGVSQTIEVPLKRLPVTEADVNEVRELYKTGRLPTLAFPEYKSSYTHLRPLGDKGFLVYNQTPYFGKVSGVYLDRRGLLKGRFHLDCGVGGALLGNSSRILSVSTTQEEEFVLQELLPL